MNPAPIRSFFNAIASLRLLVFLALALFASPRCSEAQAPPKAGDRVALQLVEGGQILPGTVKEVRPGGVYIVNVDFRLPTESRTEVATANNPGKLFLLQPDGQKGADVASLTNGNGSLAAESGAQIGLSAEAHRSSLAQAKTAAGNNASSPALVTSSAPKAAATSGPIVAKAYECVSFSGRQLINAAGVTITGTNTYTDRDGVHGTFSFDRGSSTLTFHGGNYDGQKAEYEVKAGRPSLHILGPSGRRVIDCD